MIAKFIRDRPWIWIVLLFSFVVYGAVSVLRIAGENQPERVPLISVNGER